jgi:hypothetical protein
VPLVSVIVFAGLLVFLAWRSRRNPLFLAGAAAFLVLGRSMYIDIYPYQSLLGSAPRSLTSGDLVMAVAALGWLYARARRPVPRAHLAPVWAGLGILVASFLGLEFALAWAGATELHPTYIAATRDWFYIPLGYMLTLDVLRRFTTDEIGRFIGVLSFFTICAAGLYIASALNLPIYPYEKSVTVQLGGTTIIRDFSAMPYWFGLAWCYYLSQPRKKLWMYVALAVVACAVLASYTRSLLALLVLTALLATVLLMVRQGQRSRAIILGVVCTVLAVAVLVLGPVVAPAQFGYLQGRFGGLAQSRSLSDDPTTRGRLRDFERARAAGARIDPYLGAGLFDPSVSLYGRQYWNLDSDWIGIVYRTGWAGIIVFAVPLAVGLWRAVHSYVTHRVSGLATTLLLIGLLSTVWFIGWRFASTVYLWWPAVSLLSVALVARAEARPSAGAPASTPAQSRTECPRYLDAESRP